MPDEVAGQITVALTDGVTVAVTFPVTMPDTNYVVLLQPQGNLGALCWPSALTTSGFTLNLSVAAAGTVAFHAVHIVVGSKNDVQTGQH